MKSIGNLREMIQGYLKEHQALYRAARALYLGAQLCGSPVLFRLTMIRQKPYFGPILTANQLNPQRAPIMRKLLECELEKGHGRYRVLEIGSWAGQSTTLWAAICKERGRGQVYCIDTWAASENVPAVMKRAVEKNKIFKLFLHNIKASGLEDYIVPLKGSSNVFAQVLRAGAFDFVYIDGDHAYTQFKRDLLNYMPRVRAGGIICGDDLELQLDEADIRNARRNREVDYILDPRTKKYFHPSITLGIAEVFGAVSARAGFWAMRKFRRGWKKVAL